MRFSQFIELNRQWAICPVCDSRRPVALGKSGLGQHSAEVEGL